MHLRLGRKAPELETFAIVEEVGLEAPATSPDYLERNREAWGRWSPGSAATGAKAWRTRSCSGASGPRRPRAADRPLQLKVAERLQTENRLSFSLVYANVEDVPFGGESLDVVISEYGASVWSDPRYWLREAHRLLRPNGRLVSSRPARW